MNKFYVGHEVIIRKKFNNRAFAHDLIGCNLKCDYYVSKKVVLLNRDNDGVYNYYGTSIVTNCRLIDPNGFVSFYEVLGCNDCLEAFKVNANEDCSLNPATCDKYVGIIDIQPLSTFTNTRPDETELALLLINEYNNGINDDLEYVPISDDTYVKVIRTIDDGISKVKRKELK